MKLLRRPWWISVVLAGLLLLAYSVSRLTHLTLLPIFTDEAIYIRWSQIGGTDSAWRFISLTDGKQPLFTWLMMVVLRVFHDPLFAGRFVSVLAGAGSMVGIWVLTRELFGRKVAWWASFLYLLFPFTLMYDRLALYDSLVATFFIWNLYLAILLVRHVRLDIALILGLTLGAGMLNKSSGFLNLYLLPLTLFLFRWEEPRKMHRLLQWIGLAGVAAVLSQMVYGVLRLSPLFYMIEEKNAVFIYPFSEWIKHPVEFFVGNMRGLLDWLQGYMTWPVLAASFLPLLIFWHKLREKVMLYGWVVAPLVALALFAKVLYPRYILFMTMPLVILAAYGMVWLFDRIKPMVWRVALLAFFFTLWLRTDYFIITNPLYAQIPEADRGQMIDNWPAGWGIAEVNAFLANVAQTHDVAVYTDGTFGLLPAAIEIYLVGNPHVEIHGMWPLPKSMPPELIASAKKKPTYFVLNAQQEIPAWSMNQLFVVQKGLRTDRNLRFFQIVVPSETVLRVRP